MALSVRVFSIRPSAKPCDNGIDWRAPALTKKVKLWRLQLKIIDFMEFTQTLLLFICFYSLYICEYYMILHYYHCVATDLQLWGQHLTRAGHGFIEKCLVRSACCRTPRSYQCCATLLRLNFFLVDFFKVLVDREGHLVTQFMNRNILCEQNRSCSHFNMPQVLGFVSVAGLQYFNSCCGWDLTLHRSQHLPKLFTSDFQRLLLAHQQLSLFFPDSGGFCAIFQCCNMLQYSIWL